MTLYEFNALGDNEKAMAVWDGEFIDYRGNRLITVHLYALPEFYVEVYYAPVTNQIIKFRSFSCLSQLEPYLNNIDISTLIP